MLAFLALGTSVGPSSSNTRQLVEHPPSLHPRSACVPHLRRRPRAQRGAGVGSSRAPGTTDPPGHPSTTRLVLNPDPVRTVDDVAAHVEHDLRLGAPGTIGAELEWFVFDTAQPAVRPPLARVNALLAPLDLPGGSLLTTEPGGQVELSSVPHSGPLACTEALAADLTVVRSALEADGLRLVGGGTDPLRPPERLLELPRYACMDAFFSSDGGPSGAAGRAMMCSTAAVQVSVDAGLPGDGAQSARQRWHRAHALGPALIAAFACSPVLSGVRSGWASTRQLQWQLIDPSRTRPPEPTLGPVEALTDLAWNARLLVLHDDDSGDCVQAPAATFREWAQGALPTLPTSSDLAYHLTTLFPPVRARGWYELRYLDGLPDPLWQVAVAVAAALMDDDRAADAAREAAAPVEGRWAAAARLGTSDPELRRAAVGCLVAAAEALPRLGAPSLARAVEAYAESYPRRGRSPAEDPGDVRLGLDLTDTAIPA
jgi:glutamate--cysteine ligase